MSASVETSAIFMNDTTNQIKNKINKYAFSGGQVTEAEQRELGGVSTLSFGVGYSPTIQMWS